MIPKRAIVTGATGFVGAHFVELLLQHDVEVWAIHRPNSPAVARLPQNKNLHLVSCGLEQLTALGEHLEGTPFDVFYHLGWDSPSGAGRSDAERQWNNIGYTLQAVQLASRLHCGKFIATGTVFEKLAPHVAQTEEYHPSDFYILSKQAAHHMADKLAKKLDLPFVWSTFFHPIGRYMKKEQMMAYAISCMIRKETPTFGPAQEPYDIVAVEDVAYGLFLLGSSNLTRREYYIGSGSPRIMQSYLEHANSVLGTNVPLGIGERPDDGLRLHWEWYDIQPLKQDTGYTAQVTIEEAFLRTAEWIQTGLV